MRVKAIKSVESSKRGERIKVIRTYLGKTQQEFGELLGKWGITGRNGEPGVSAEVVASWESGRNKARDKVLRAIMDNVPYEGCKIKWSFLIGNSELITNKPRGWGMQLARRTLTDKWPSPINEVSADDLSELCNSPINKWASILNDTLLPFFGYSAVDIRDLSQLTNRSIKDFEKYFCDYITSQDKE